MLRTVEELESARILLVAGMGLASILAEHPVIITLTSTGGAAFWRLMLVKNSRARKKRKKWDR
jgi:hypothetical protein